MPEMLQKSLPNTNSHQARLQLAKFTSGMKTRGYIGTEISIIILTSGVLCIAIVTGQLISAVHAAYAIGSVNRYWL